MAYAGRYEQLELRPVAPSIPDQQLADLARSLLSQHSSRVGLIVSQRLRASARAVLEGLGAAYADGQGRLHLPMPHLLVHLEAAKPTTRARERTPGLGPSGVRAVQALLASDEALPLTQLSRHAALSLAQTHTVLRLLEEVEMLRSTGTGPSRRRSVIDRGALLQWLAEQSPARRREPQLDVSIYARRPEELWHQVAAKLGAADVEYAITGAAGAALYGAGPTAVPLTAVRVSPDIPLDRAAVLLGAEPTDRGANVRLLRDTGRVGTIGAEHTAGIAVAPKVRVYLDALSERRGDDVAEHFREVILGY